MSDLQKNNFNRTKSLLLNAVERLKKGEPTEQTLIKKAEDGKLKLNRSTVEKEAGLGSGTLRHHQDVVDIITLSCVGGEEAEQVDILTKEIRELKDKLKKVNKINKSKIEKVKNMDVALSQQAAQQIMLMAAMLEKIPYDDREQLMKKIISNNVRNIRPI
jgi:hypothetical protein|tara:strand:- start:1356 stop:1835 length:480 start_codon:yes stop_codon:yes gene_type:complete